MLPDFRTVSADRLAAPSCADATICWARMSSGDFGNHQAIKITLADGAHQRRTFLQLIARGGKESAFGNRSTPVTGTSYPLQATAIARGELICTTKSTVPISIPSSNEAVATSTLTWPSLSLFSAVRRSLRERLPWWAATLSSPSRSAR